MFEETRNALAAFMKESKKSQRQLSKETGLSTSVISQFLNGTYPGDNGVVSKTIEQYLTVGKERLSSVSEARFYEGLYNTREVLFACNYAHRNNDITLVSGDAGAGKNFRHRKRLYHHRNGHFKPYLPKNWTADSSPPRRLDEYSCGSACRHQPPDYH